MISSYYMKNKGYHAVFDIQTGADESATDLLTPDRLSGQQGFLRNGFLSGGCRQTP